MPTLGEPLLLTRLASARRVLVAGAGGGFDVYAGLPLALALRARGQEVHLANLTFTYLGGTDAPWLAPHLAAVYAFEKVGVRPLRAAYATLVAKLGIDAIVLVDGGTDILMRGDEAGLGTPEEDMTSLAAVAGLEVAHRLVACIGFGIDAYHGVCHAQFLENVAALERDGAYLGAFSVPRQTDEGAADPALTAGSGPGASRLTNTGANTPAWDDPWMSATPRPSP